MELMWILVTVYLLQCWTPSQAHVRHVVHEQTTPQASCIHGNSSYPAGTRFRPDPCSFCRCPREGGRAHCAIEDCFYEANCVRSVKTQESECCEVCVEIGCRWSDGRVYRGGDVISVSPCQTCRCPEGGGAFECTKVSCLPPDCVNPVKPSDGGCCLECPDGPNCWLGRRVISAGQTITDGHCRTCRCQKHSAWVPKRGPRARCSTENCTN